MSPSQQTLWRGAPVLLASRSVGRARLLREAGVVFDVVVSAFDEREFESAHRFSPETLAERLAFEKARVASMSYPNRIVIGADQVLALDDVVLHKCETVEAARGQLLAMRGRMHHLHSAVSVVCDGEPRFSCISTARIQMHEFSDALLDGYIALMGERLLATVGAYEIEGLGVNLMERIDGDYFTVVGLPLLPLLAYFRRDGLMVGSGEGA